MASRWPAVQPHSLRRGSILTFGALTCEGRIALVLPKSLSSFIRAVITFDSDNLRNGLYYSGSVVDRLIRLVLA
jgi:hypothetical protein